MTLTIETLGHGMGSELEDKDWAHLSLEALQPLQAYYSELQGELKILWRSPRPFSSAAMIQVNAQTAYFVKRSHTSFRSAQDILQEHGFIQHLAVKGIAVPELIHSNLNSTATEIGDWTYELHHQAHGLDCYANQLSWKPFFYSEHAAKAGKMLAELHEAAQDYVADQTLAAQQGRTAKYLVSNQALLDSADLIGAIQQRIDNSPELTAYFSDKTLDPALLDYLNQLHQKVQPYLRNCPKIWTHNDIHGSNFFWSSCDVRAEISTVIDFGLSDRNTALYDLAIAIERNFIDWLALADSTEIAVDLHGLAAFMQAYLAQAPETAQLKILVDLVKIVHIDFAFSELEYFVGITRNLKHADAAYYDWLISHMHWFLSAQGQAFTTQLEQYLVPYIPLE